MEIFPLLRSILRRLLKTALADSFVQKAHLFGGSAMEARGCLTGSGQLQVGTISLLYRAERATYYGTRCWILEFAWGSTGSGIQEFRCCVMDAGTFNPRLIFASRVPQPPLPE